jgi:hypothetical protein
MINKIKKTCKRIRAQRQACTFLKRYFNATLELMKENGKDTSEFKGINFYVSVSGGRDVGFIIKFGEGCVSKVKTTYSTPDLFHMISPDAEIISKLKDIGFGNVFILE